MSPDNPTPKKDNANLPSKKEKAQSSRSQDPTRPMPPVETPDQDPLADIDEGPRAGPVDEIQAALFEATQAGVSKDMDFEQLAKPKLTDEQEPTAAPSKRSPITKPDLPKQADQWSNSVLEIDEGPRPGPVDDVQAALFHATQEGLSTEVSLDDLPEPSPTITQKVVKFKPKTSAPQADPTTKVADATSVAPDAISTSEEISDKIDLDEATPPDDSPEAADIQADIKSKSPLLTSISAEYWFILAIFVSFRVLTLFLLRPGGFIRDWSDFDTYFGIAALSDYNLFPFFDFWLEWPPLIPWLAVGVYRLSLWLPPWEDPRLWFVLLMGGTFLLFEIGNFMLIYRLARRLFQDTSIIKRVLWFYVGLFVPIYTMLGFFDGITLFFMLLALDLLLNNQRFPAAIATGVGVMVKIIPVLILPVAIRRLWHQHQDNNKDAGIEIGLYAAAFGLTLIIILLPFLIIGPQWVLTSARSMVNRSSWETIWAVMEGYYGFGIVQGNRFNPAEINFSAPIQDLSLFLWIVRTFGPWVLAGLYLFIFTRPANYNKPRNIIAFSGLTITIFTLYSKGYSPQFLVYLLPFIVLLMPNGRGLTYALVLTGLNILEQPIYFVLLPDASWLLIFVVIARFVVITLIAAEFVMLIWPPAEYSPQAQVRQYVPHILAGTALLSMLVLTPLLISTYRSSALANSPVKTVAGFLQSQGNSASNKARLLLNEQNTYRLLYPHLNSYFDLQLTDGPDKAFAGAATLADLLRDQEQVWVLSTGPQQISLNNAVAARGSELAAYNFDGLGTVSRYSFVSNTAPVLPPARFVGGMQLLGHHINTQSQALELTLYWRTLNPQSRKLTVFTQLLNENGELIASHDSEPGNGTAPVTTWNPGNVYPDSHLIPLPANLPSGSYTLITGLYNSAGDRIHPRSAAGLGFDNRAVPLTIIELP